jgi:hypothetical protein
VGHPEAHTIGGVTVNEKAQVKDWTSQVSFGLQAGQGRLELTRPLSEDEAVC